MTESLPCIIEQVKRNPEAYAAELGAACLECSRINNSARTTLVTPVSPGMFRSEIVGGGNSPKPGSLCVKGAKL